MKPGQPRANGITLEQPNVAFLLSSKQRRTVFEIRPPSVKSCKAHGRRDSALKRPRRDQFMFSFSAYAPLLHYTY